MKKRLAETKQYLRTDFKLHLHRDSSIGDHCMRHALSDPNDDELSSSCSDGPQPHTHSIKCDRCESLKALLGDVRAAIEDQITLEKQKPPSEQRNNAISEHAEMLKTAYDCEKRIIDLKKHQLRAVWSEQQQTSIIQEQKEEVEGLLTIDWAQKFLPQKAHETQRVSKTVTVYKVI
jgi:hypothetical protein